MNISNGNKELQQPITITYESLIHAFEKICGDKSIYIGYCNSSCNFSLSEKSIEDLSSEIINIISNKQND